MIYDDGNMAVPARNRAVALCAVPRSRAPFVRSDIAGQAGKSIAPERLWRGYNRLP